MIPVESRVQQGVKVVGSGEDSLFDLVRVSPISDLPGARHVTVWAPYLSAHPDELVDVSLVNVFISSVANCHVMVGRVVEAVVFPRVVLRHVVNVDRHGFMRYEVAQYFNYPGRGFGIRRVVCGGQVLPFIAVVVPKAGAASRQIGAENREIYPLRRCLFVFVQLLRAMSITVAAVRRGARVVDALV